MATLVWIYELGQANSHFQFHLLAGQPHPCKKELSNEANRESNQHLSPQCNEQSEKRRQFLFDGQWHNVNKRIDCNTQTDHNHHTHQSRNSCSPPEWRTDHYSTHAPEYEQEGNNLWPTVRD